VARLGDLILQLPSAGRIAVLGLAYKAGTDVIEESQAVQLVEYLAAAGRRVIVYDPAAMANARAALGDSVAFAESMEECVTDAAVIAIATPWEEFKQLSVQGEPAIFDWWRILPSSVETLACGRASGL
jgi:UDPglucose 6-dehydrogenase